MKSRLLVLLVAGLCFASVSGDAQTTTGRLIGRTIDDEGAALPGVTVTITSDVMIGGAQTKISDGGGEFSFLSLFPGDYTVRAELSGFVIQERQEVKVPLGGAASLIISMPLGTFTDEITVAADAPVVDPLQTGTKQIFDLPYLQQASIGSDNRSYQLMIGQTAGVTGSSNPNVFGSTDAENAYFIDGQDTTDPQTGSWGVIFNYDSIAEIEFQTSGFEAEYGRASAGLVNIVTKSGSNQFHGSADIRYFTDSFQEDGDHYDASTLDSSREDLGLTLGGPMVRDKLWFFAAYEYIGSENTPTGSPTTRKATSSNYNLKLSWQIAPNWRTFGRYAGSPAEIDNRDAEWFIAEEATTYQKQQNDIFSAEINGLLSQNLMWNTVVGAYRSAFDIYPMSRDLVTPSHFNFVTGMRTANAASQEYTERDRNDFATDLTWFVDGLAGSHEFKGGFQYSATEFSGATCSTGTTGGACSAGSVGYSYQDLQAFTALPYFLIEATTAGTQTNTGKLWTAFLQDSWRVLPNLTLKLGVRYDNVKYDNNDDQQVADLSKTQPRLGFAWDITGDAKNVVRANWGRFMDPSNLTLPYILRAGREPTATWYSCSTLGSQLWGVTTPEECAMWSGIFGWGYRGDDPDNMDPLGWFLPPFAVSGLGDTLYQDDLRAAYADTLSLSYEREVGRRASVEFAYVDKKTRDIMEDTCADNIPVPVENQICAQSYLGNLPDMARDYQGFIVRFESRSFNWLTLLTSYTYSKSEGNLESSYPATSAFDIFPYHFVNRYGYLRDHREHRFKLNGYFNIKGDWTIGFDGYWSSVFKWEPQLNPSDNPAIRGGVEFLEPRGSRDGDQNHQLDLQLSKGFTISNVRLVLIGTVYNAFSSENALSVCDQFSGCGSFQVGDSTSWQIPRRYELGLRVEF